jgi:arylsulfatase A-like enzyme
MWQRDPQRPIDPESVVIPPYYPDTPMVRRDWANGLEQAQITDRRVGKLLARLESDGHAPNTLVILIGDHGRCMPRGKQFLYDGGIHIPLIMRWPGHIKPGTVCDDLVTSIDITRTIVDVAGAKPMHPLHGVNLFTDAASKRRFIFAARDKMDDTHDAMRAVRTKKFKYIHNLMPERAYCQYNPYKEMSYPTLAVLNVMNMKGQLSKVQSAFMAAKKPQAELYNLETDPWEINNLAGDPKYASIEKELRGELDRWRVSVNDAGVTKQFRKGGWPSTYPTRSLELWESIVKVWKPWVFRDADARGRGLHPRRVIMGSGISK